MRPTRIEGVERLEMRDVIKRKGIISGLMAHFILKDRYLSIDGQVHKIPNHHGHTVAYTALPDYDPSRTVPSVEEIAAGLEQTFDGSDISVRGIHEAAKNQRDYLQARRIHGLLELARAHSI